MKSLKLFKSFVIFSVLFGLQGATAQIVSYTYNIPTSGGSINATGPAVQGSVIFDLANETASFVVTNTSSVAGEITAVYMLKPFGLNISTDTSGTPPDSDFWYTPQYESASNLIWQPSNSMATDLFQELPGGGQSDYFGASIQSPSSDDTIESDPAVFPAIPLNETVTFSFTIPGLSTAGDTNAFLSEYFDTDGNYNANLPHLAFRWKSLPNDVNEGSAKGYGWFDVDIPVIPVPEPSQIAALSMAGLAGLLFVRRRIKAKRAAKA